MKVGEKKTVELEEVEFKKGDIDAKVGDSVFLVKNGMFAQFDVIEIEGDKIVAKFRGSSEL